MVGSSQTDFRSEDGYKTVVNFRRRSPLSGKSFGVGYKRFSPFEKGIVKFLLPFILIRKKNPLQIRLD